MDRRKFIKVATSAVIGVVIATESKDRQSSLTAKSSSSISTIHPQNCSCGGSSSDWFSESSSRIEPDNSVDCIDIAIAAIKSKHDLGTLEERDPFKEIHGTIPCPKCGSVLEYSIFGHISGSCTRNKTKPYSCLTWVQ